MPTAGRGSLAPAWPEASAKDETARSPGQWTADIRGGSTGNTWDSENWRDYGRLETLYGPQIIELMTAENDEETMRLWAGGAGWAGLMRALFLTLRDEQDERPDNPGHTPGKLFVALLVEKLIHHARAISPWGYDVPPPAPPQPVA